MSHTIERDWITEAGLRAVCLMFHDCGHRCGYIGVPPEHPLFGVKYDEESDALKESLAAVLDGPVGKRGVISLFCMTAGEDCQPRPEYVFDVHGSLTYSAAGDYPVKSELWWFGFDCGHAGDSSKYCNGEGRTEEYVVSECESLAAQVAAIVNTDAPSTTLR